ncbi:ATP-binding protein [Pontibacter sp. G13]|uniref:sensor histidine kinase n=1 Tax=Pontibacter sp. G13 TaxID=3074898 RepID=UPI00288BED14|nr:ATP-binding protein [Pontibacter sp. G13]WNJ20454.1 ATP-binding protein [Pontibacter sp. G13]
MKSLFASLGFLFLGLGSIAGQSPDQDARILVDSAWAALEESFDIDAGLTFGTQGLNLAVSQGDSTAVAYASVCLAYLYSNTDEPQIGYSYMNRAFHIRVKSSNEREALRAYGSAISFYSNIYELDSAFHYASLWEANRSMVECCQGLVDSMQLVIADMYMANYQEEFAKEAFESVISRSKGCTWVSIRARVGMMGYLVVTENHEEVLRRAKALEECVRSFGDSLQLLDMLLLQLQVHVLDSSSIEDYEPILDEVEQIMEAGDFQYYGQLELNILSYLNAKIQRDLMGDYDSLSVSTDLNKLASVCANIQDYRILETVYWVSGAAWEELGEMDSALLYLYYHSDAKDSVMYMNSQDAIAKHETDIARVHAKQKQKELRLWQGIGGTIMLLIFALSAGWIGWNRQKMKLAVSEMKTLNKERVLHALHVAQEKERKEIAEDLHDSVAPDILGISRYLEILQSGTASDELWGKVKDYTQQTSQRVRNMSHDLFSSSLNYLSLPQATQALLDRKAEALPFKLELRVTGSWTDPMAKWAKIDLYRIIESSLQNAIKHADPNQVIIFLDRSDEILTLEITDDGKGFDPAKASEGDGIGFMTLDARVRRLGAQYDLKTSPGAGTCIRVQGNWHPEGAKPTDDLGWIADLD